MSLDKKVFSCIVLGLLQNMNSNVLTGEQVIILLCVECVLRVCVEGVSRECRVCVEWVECVISVC